MTDHRQTHRHWTHVADVALVQHEILRIAQQRQNINSEEIQRKQQITLILGKIRCDVSVTDKQVPD